MPRPPKSVPPRPATPPVPKGWLKVYGYQVIHPGDVGIFFVNQTDGRTTRAPLDDRYFGKKVAAMLSPNKCTVVRKREGYWNAVKPRFKF